MKNNRKKLLSLLLAVLMTASLSVTAFAADGDFTGNSMSGGNDFYYTVTKENVYTDISGVKLSWSVPVLNYTETDVRTWNTTSLKWEQSYEHDNAQEVTFTLTNRGSYQVKASVSFTPTVADSAAVDFVKNSVNTNNKILGTIVNSDHSLKETDTSKQAAYLADNCSATITGTVSLSASKLSADSGKLGTYTVSIRNTKHTVTVNMKEEMTGYAKQQQFTVDDGAEITVDADTHAITIGGNIVENPGSYGMPPHAFRHWEYNGTELAVSTTYTVSSDMTINAVYSG